MLGITKLSPGRMGNRLFHYHFLRQVAAKTGIGYFNIKFPEAKYFENLNKIKRPFHLFRKQIKINSQEIKKFKPEQLLNLIIEKNNLNYDLIFKPPILGEVFFDYLFCSPNNIIKIKKEYQKKFEFETINKIIIGLHFRGTDFANWNGQASLKFSYYKEAIEYCNNYFQEKKLIFIIFTDDLNFKTYLETINYLKDNKLEFYVSNNLNSPICDFYQISQCDVLISSPSTFAIFAACLGKQKKIIHSKEWLNYAINQNDKFWVDFKETNNPYYSLWKSI